MNRKFHKSPKIQYLPRFIMTSDSELSTKGIDTVVIWIAPTWYCNSLSILCISSQILAYSTKNLKKEWRILSVCALTDYQNKIHFDWFSKEKCKNKSFCLWARLKIMLQFLHFIYIISIQFNLKKSRGMHYDAVDIWFKLPFIVRRN